MAEVLTLAVPETTPEIVNAQYKIAYIGLTVRPASSASVLVHLEGDNGERIEVRTSTAAEAITFLRQLDTADLSVTSLQKRCLEWCAGKLARLTGVVTGTPD